MKIHVIYGDNKQRSLDQQPQQVISNDTNGSLVFDWLLLMLIFYLSLNCSWWLWLNLIDCVWWLIDCIFDCVFDCWGPRTNCPIATVNQYLIAKYIQKLKGKLLGNCYLHDPLTVAFKIRMVNGVFPPNIMFGLMEGKRGMSLLIRFGLEKERRW